MSSSQKRPRSPTPTPSTSTLAKGIPEPSSMTAVALVGQGQGRVGKQSTSAVSVSGDATAASSASSAAKKCYYGAKTRGHMLRHQLPSGDQSAWRLPRPLIQAYGYLKKAAAMVKQRRSDLDPRLAEAICRAADGLIDGSLYEDHFPITIWQADAGLAVDDNVNEVIAGRANEILAEEGLVVDVDPDTHVGMEQCATGKDKEDRNGGTFLAAMQIAIAKSLATGLIPALKALLVRAAQLDDSGFPFGLREPGQELQDLLERLEVFLTEVYELQGDYFDSSITLWCIMDISPSLKLCKRTATQVAQLTGLPFVATTADGSGRPSRFEYLNVLLEKATGEVKNIGDKLGRRGVKAGTFASMFADKIRKLPYHFADEDGLNPSRAFDVLRSAHLLQDACQILITCDTDKTDSEDSDSEN